MINLSGYRVKILCEDDSHFYFLQGVFKALKANVSDRDKPFKKISGGRGCGAQTVITGFKELVEATCKNRENIVFAAIIDGDGESFEQRKQLLYDKITQDEQQRVDNMDNFFVAIPRRNIETWLLFCLQTQAGDENMLDEETNYKRSGMSIKCKSLGKWIVDKTREGSLNYGNLESLKIFCEQFQ